MRDGSVDHQWQSSGSTVAGMKRWTLTGQEMTIGGERRGAEWGGGGGGGVQPTYICGPSRTGFKSRTLTDYRSQRQYRYGKVRRTP